MIINSCTLCKFLLNNSWQQAEWTARHQRNRMMFVQGSSLNLKRIPVKKGKALNRKRRIFLICLSWNKSNSQPWKRGIVVASWANPWNLWGYTCTEIFALSGCCFLLCSPCYFAVSSFFPPRIVQVDPAADPAPRELRQRPGIPARLRPQEPEGWGPFLRGPCTLQGPLTGLSTRGHTSSVPRCSC